MGVLVHPRSEILCGASLPGGVARITQHANHFPIDGGYMRDSTADSSAKRAQRGCKRKSQSFVQVDSASASISKVERILKCPKLAAVRERILAKSV